MKKSFILLLCLVGFIIPVYTQTDTLLTPDEAVAIALEQNFAIRIAQADVEIARLNNTRGNAGMLPTVDLLVNENFTVSAFNQKRSNGTELSDFGVPINSAGASVLLNWTLFDGRRMFIAKKRLEQLEQLENYELQASVQQTTALVLQAYFNIVASRLQEKAIAEVISLNEERMRIAEGRLASGLAAQTDALQARVDLNQRRSDLIAQENNTAQAKRNLNQLLVRDPQTPFSVVDSIQNTYAPARESLLANLRGQNSALLALQKNAEVTALLVEEARALFRPRIVGIGELNLARNDNPAGFAINNTQGGLTVGASLVIPLYSGGNLQRQVDVARVQAEQAAIRVDAERLNIETLVDNQLAAFRTQEQLFAMEEENVKTSRQLLQISTERFRLGQTNALEVSTAQNSLEQALARRNLVLYNLRIAEVQLRLLENSL